LIELDLSKNAIHEIPEEIGKLINLTWLNFNGNYLTKVPKEIEISWGN